MCSSRSSERESGKRSYRANFDLEYALHFGKFENSAREDLIDLFNFMSDQGFTALEDNGLKSKTVDEHDAIGRELERLNMEMGYLFATRRASRP
jgi:hydroxypyruvate isomerase